MSRKRKVRQAGMTREAAWAKAAEVGGSVHWLLRGVVYYVRYVDRATGKYRYIWE